MASEASFILRPHDAAADPPVKYWSVARGNVTAAQGPRNHGPFSQEEMGGHEEILQASLCPEQARLSASVPNSKFEVQILGLWWWS